MSEQRRRAPRATTVPDDPRTTAEKLGRASLVMKSRKIARAMLDHVEDLEAAARAIAKARPSSSVICARCASCGEWTQPIARLGKYLSCVRCGAPWQEKTVNPSERGI